MKKIFNILIFTCLALGLFWGCELKTEDTVITPVNKSILQVLQENPTRYSTLVGLATKVGGDVVTLLSTTVADSLTLYAPTNEAFTSAAFTNALTALGFANLDAVPNNVLREILLYHISNTRAQYSITGTGLVPNPIPANVIANGLITMRNAVALTGGDPTRQIYVNRRGFGGGIGTIDAINGYARFVTGAFNLRTSNGVIHSIDRVLLPPVSSSYQIITTLPQFSLFAYAVNRSSTIVTRLQGTSAITVLAPTNAAMTAAGLVDNAAIDAIAIADLEAILNRHIVTSRQSSNDIVNRSTDTDRSRQTPTMGVNLFFSPRGNDILINNVAVLGNPGSGSRRGVNVDLIAYNGFVHEVNNVIPLAVATSAPGDVNALLAADAASATPQFTFLREALRVSGLVFSGSTTPSLGQVSMGVIWQNEALSETQGLILANAVPNAPGSSNSTGGTTYTVSPFSGPYTVFAPTNAAFQAAGFATIESITNADAATRQNLRNILRYHILPVRRYYADLANGAINTLLWNSIAFIPPAAFNVNNLPAPTTNYRQLVIGVAGGTFTVRDGRGNVVTIPTASRNVVTGNAIVHVVDRVLLPQ
jgi:transforming growth factor-beta-induced protein